MKILFSLTFLLLSFVQFLYASSVGSPKGLLHVNGMGAAVYSLTFDTPDDNKLAPHIGLSYNSQSYAYGIVGYGFDISGLSVITTGGRDMYHDAQILGNSHDQSSTFYLDGKRLLLLRGISGEDNSEYNPEGDPHTIVKFHGSFTSTTTSPWFEMLTKDGSVYWYGKSSSSQYGYTNGTSDRHVVAWYIEYAEDKYGNCIRYDYERHSNRILPFRIRYGGRNTTETDYPDVIQFKYKPMAHSNIRCQRIGKEKVTVDCLLESVTVSRRKQCYRKYDFCYDESSNYSQLISVTESNGAGDKYPPIKFSWDNGTDDYLSCYENSAITSFNTERFIEYNTTTNYFSADVNGDGISDILRISPIDCHGLSQVVLTIQQSTIGENSIVSYGNSISSYTFPPELKAAKPGPMSCCDFDGDGLQDVILTYYLSYPSRKIDCQIIYGKNVSEHKEGRIPVARIDVKAASSTPLYTCLDMDGDGRDELFVIERESQNGIYYGGILTYSSQYGADTEGVKDVTLRYRPQFHFDAAPKKIYTADFNNDGLKDIIVFTDKGYTILFNNGLTNMSNLARTFYDGNKTTGTSLADSWRIVQGDFDGDGLLDFYCYEKGNGFKLAFNNGDGTFRIVTTPSWGISDHGDSGKDDNAFSMDVVDFNRDGMSDIVIVKSMFTKHGGTLFEQTYYRYSDTQVRWLRSIGDGFEVDRTHTFHDNSFYEGYVMTGDFDGDGEAELANYGRALNADDAEKMERVLHFYKGGELICRNAEREYYDIRI